MNTKRSFYDVVDFDIVTELPFCAWKHKKIICNDKKYLFYFHFVVFFKTDVILPFSKFNPIITMKVLCVHILYVWSATQTIFGKLLYSTNNLFHLIIDLELIQHKGCLNLQHTCRNVKILHVCCFICYSWQMNFFRINFSV